MRTTGGHPGKSMPPMGSDAILTRKDIGDQGVFGVFDIRSGPRFFSGELPDRENAPGISCIPEGIYKVIWTWSPRFKRMMYLVEGVEGRAGIRAHSANLMGDASLGYKAQLNGCIALGERLGKIEGQKALLVSAPAIRKFESFMGGKTFSLEIRHA